MKSSIRYCKSCRVYTMEERCKICGAITIAKKPARFSPQDHYGRYRRTLKRLSRDGE
ncbi:MAG TPA: RNA-protein complex protein Nop10 [Thermoplasmatales archaeon]|nr:RNA-protein complex protein Nop10 [Thermoplasmatales archaeon]